MLSIRILAFLLALPLCLAACGKSLEEEVAGEKAEAAREELKQLNIPYNSLEFIKSAMRGEVSTVALFLDAGMNPNVKDNQAGRGTALWYAANNGRLEVMALLLDRGADLDAKYNFGYTVLVKAASDGQPDVVEFLLDRGADPNVGTEGLGTESGLTPLMLAAGHGDTDVVQLLLDRGADPNAKDASGRTALSWARQRRQTDIAQLLKQAGATE